MSDHIAKVKDEPNLVKDTNTGAILNTDHRGLQSYRLRKKLANETASATQRLDRLESQMAQILQLLQNLQR